MTDKFEALKALADEIAPGYRQKWGCEDSINDDSISVGTYNADGDICPFIEVSISDWSGNDDDNEKLAKFITLANPPVVSDLLAALEEKDQRIKELEGDVRFERLRLNEAEIAALIKRSDSAEQREEHLKADAAVLAQRNKELAEHNAELEQRLQQPALADVMAERQRQISAEGWTPNHDDQHTSSEMAGAAACYARHVNARGWVYSHNPDDYQCEPESCNWPWDASWWKPTNPRCDLVKAGALILAEIERLDRAAAKVEGE